MTLLFPQPFGPTKAIMRLGSIPKSKNTEGYSIIQESFKIRLDQRHALKLEFLKLKYYRLETPRLFCWLNKTEKESSVVY